MRRRLLFLLLALALLVLASIGWTADGIRWALTGRRRPRTRLAPAGAYSVA
jgi:hypothetical protein